MKHLVILAGLTLSACAQQSGIGATDAGATQAQVQRISTMAQLQPFLDRRWEFGNGNYSVVHSDGTVTGEFGGNSLTGTWEMRDGYWCRTITLANINAPPTDCQILQGDGTNFTVTREKGKGRTTDYTLGAPV